jgi:hypothetical protein
MDIKAVYAWHQGHRNALVYELHAFDIAVLNITASAHPREMQNGTLFFKLKGLCIDVPNPDGSILLGTDDDILFLALPTDVHV